jgi:hypothetical protein
MLATAITLLALLSTGPAFAGKRIGARGKTRKPVFLSDVLDTIFAPDGEIMRNLPLLVQMDVHKCISQSLQSTVKVDNHFETNPNWSHE